MKIKDFIITFWICMAILLAINNLISIGHNRRMVDILNEQQEFLGNYLHETIKTQSTILRIQGVILEILGE